MNILLCVTGFFVCFSSFGMNNEYKKDSHIEENSQGIIGGNQESNDDGISQSFTSFCMDNESKKDSQITENSQGIIGGNQESNNDDISQIANFMNKRNFRDAKNFLQQHRLDETFNFNAILPNSNERHTLFSYLLSICKNNKQDFIKNQEMDVAQLMYTLVTASECQMDEKKYVGDLYIRKNDSRIIDAMISAMHKKCFYFAGSLVSSCFIRKYLDFKTVFKYDLGDGEKEYTPFSYYLSFLKDLQCTENEYGAAADLGSVLLFYSKDQMGVKGHRPDYYIQKDDQRIRDIIITFVANKRFKFVDYFLRKCPRDILCLDYTKTFEYDLGDGKKDYTLCSLYTSVLRNDIKNSNGYDQCFVWLLPFKTKTLVVLSFLDELHFKKNDPEVIDIGLSAIDRKKFNFEDFFFDDLTLKYLDFDVIMEWEDISQVVFSFYYMYFVESTHGKYSFANKTRNILCSRDKTYDLTKKYKENMLKMISYLEEKKYHRLARLFLKEYFSNESIDTQVIEHSILSCYQYVLNQMEIRENVDAGALQSIAKPQVGLADLKDIKIFLEEKKCHIITNTLFSEYGPNKVLDANAVFKYDVGGCEKACTPVTLSVLYTLTELAERNKKNKLSEKAWEKRKNFLAKSARRMQDNYLLGQCIENTQGSRQQSLISLKENINIKKYALVYGYYEHLYNEIMKYGMKIKLQIINEYKTCIEIMKLMLYYQEH